MTKTVDNPHFGYGRLPIHVADSEAGSLACTVIDGWNALVQHKLHARILFYGGGQIALRSDVYAAIMETDFPLAALAQTSRNVLLYPSDRFGAVNIGEIGLGMMPGRRPAIRASLVDQQAYEDRFETSGKES